MKKIPRELRDMIYTVMYVQDEPITLSMRTRPHYSESPGTEDGPQGPDCKINGWPEDTAGFMNRDIVGFETSQEAAKIFYSSNTFLIRGTSHLHELGDYDQYRSGVIPIYNMQNIILHIDYLSPYNHFPNSYDDRYRWRVPDNAMYMKIQNKDKLRHNMEILFGLLEGRHRHPGTLQIYVHRESTGPWDPRDIFHHLVNLKNYGLAVNLKVSRSFRPLEPYPAVIASDAELDWVDVSSYLDKPTEEEKQLLTKPHRGWKATFPELFKQIRGTPAEGAERAIRGRAFDFPCEGGSACSKDDHEDCSDHSWHAGWYRALLHDLSERTLERELTDSDFDSCRFCPDESGGNRVETRAMRIEFPKRDHNARLH